MDSYWRVAIRTSRPMTVIMLCLLAVGYIGYRNGLSEMTSLKANFMSVCSETATVRRCDRLWLIARGQTSYED